MKDDIAAVLPPPMPKRTKDDDRIDPETMRAAFSTFAGELEMLSDTELKRVVRAVLALRGFTWEDLEP